MTETVADWNDGETRVRLRQDLAALPPYRAGARPQPAAGITRLFSLASNESHHAPLPAAQEAIRRHAESTHRYPDPTSRALIEALARRHGLPDRGIVVGTGSVALCQQAVTAAAGPGDEVLFAWRSFEAYPIITGIAGATAVTVPLTAEAEHDLPAMAAAVGDRTRVIFLCSPNNPTGPILLQKQVDEFLNRVPSDVLVIIDEAYHEYVTDPAAVDGFRTAADHGNVVALRTFSKAYGLAGLRVGYGAGPPALLDRFRQVAMPFGVNALAEAAATACVTAGDEIEARVAEVGRERDRVAAVLAAQGWRIPDSQANFLWLPTGDRTDDFVADCGRMGVTVRGFSGEGVRVTIAEPEAVERIIEVASRYAPGR